jgi:tRNA A-37 threonylcarbamoyl transferase component Bud32
VDDERFLADVALARASLPQGLRIGSFRGSDGARLWLKQVERHGLRGRMTKGSAQRSFEKDRAGLRILAEAGVPVAPILAEGPDFFVTPDLGPTLQVLLEGPPGAARERAFAAAGAALARLHRSGLCHGRPALRDTCWDGTTARFIDLERFSPRRTGTGAYAADLLVFLWSGHSTGLDCRADLDAMAQSYLKAAPPGLPDALTIWLKRLDRLRPVLALLCRLRPASRELRGALMTIDHVRALPAA